MSMRTSIPLVLKVYSFHLSVHMASAPLRPALMKFPDSRSRRIPIEIRIARSISIQVKINANPKATPSIDIHWDTLKFA